MNRTVTTDFWEDSKVEELSSTAKYVLLYILTSPRSNLAGCYEITYKRIGVDTGLSVGQVEKAIAELCEAMMLGYCERTNEVMIRNWDKYNWTRSPKLDKPLAVAIDRIKDQSFKSFLIEKYESTRSIPYPYPIDTVSIQDAYVSIPIPSTSTSTTGDGGSGEGVDSGKQTRRFSKPTVDEISAYAKERGASHFDAEYFYDHYESNGWMVGKTKMKDWKATVRKWLRTDSPSGRKGVSDARFDKYR